jgi:GNAT superfamily N-acetyltransferase
MVTPAATLGVRAAALADVAALARLRRAALIELGLLAPAGADAFERDAARSFGALFAQDRIASRLLVCDGEVAGCASALFWERLPYPRTSLHAELAGVYVAPAYRRAGFARLLCAATLEAARARGARRIFVHPSAAGRALYRGLGFSEGNQMVLRP